MSLSTRDVVETTGLISVVAGLLLVAYQINQATDIASAQARADYSAGWRAVDGTRQSENFAQVLAKSIYTPNELTPSEILELDAYYIGVMDQIESAKANWEAGIRTSHWQISLDNIALLYFGNEFSHAWWGFTREAYLARDDGQFVATLDAAINPVATDRQKKVIEALQKTGD